MLPYDQVSNRSGQLVGPGKSGLAPGKVRQDGQPEAERVETSQHGSA